MKGEVIAICASSRKGTKKMPRESGYFEEDYGLVGDAHAEKRSKRQVSLLSEESIQLMRSLGLDVGPGDFAENITVRNFRVHQLQPGTRLRIGQVLLEITQVGKQCHSRCAIYRQVGKCIMPEQGVFARVLKGGEVRVGDRVEIAGEEG
ncbi:MAG: MOSC domain-containing protein [Deltaproteobacteria bacterium]|nr:MAG: MOSC domain-containing protein [Deltaproteobacteria bacterium]